MNRQELQQFLDKMASGDYTNEEYNAFTYWVANCGRDEYEQMLMYWEKAIGDNNAFNLTDDHLFEKIEADLDRADEQTPAHQHHNNVNRRRFLWTRFIAAASVLLFLSAGLNLVFQKKQINRPLTKNQSHDIAPGGNKAILTLANGQKILLDNAKSGVVANQGNATINKKQDGQLVYNALAGKAGSAVYDTLTTPYAGTYHLVLADGTKVWLNAATSIRYPVAFSGKYRTVELLYGEAYYEVVHNGKMPFRVITAGQTIQDIGTHFNINAYRDERAVKTTLLEGSVSVSKGNEATILKPDQQAQVNSDGKIQVTDNVDADEVTAWKDGFFQFTNADIQTIMRQLARWYDVKVVYEGPISRHLFTGDIHRDIKASEAMQILTYLKIGYKITGKEIIITSNINK
ncbi:MAG: FecR family protein [Mucilaginibacter sp.]